MPASHCQSTQPIVLFQTGIATTVILEVDGPACLKHAAVDFVADGKEATGVEPAIAIGIPPRGVSTAIIPLVVDRSPMLKALESSGRLNLAGFRGLSESFKIVALGSPAEGIAQALLVIGTDPNGAMYGLYELSERVYGTDPLKFWTDHAPIRRERVTWEEPDLQVGPPTFRYRGLFINDEDSLIGWKGEDPTAQILDETVYARILETICRLKGNLIAPAMFARYMTPETRRLAQERGLYYTASHLEILLSNPQNYWVDFCQRTWGREFPYSYTSYPEKLRAYWADSISRHKDYRNIWPVGLKGITDFAFWFSDATAPATVEQRAEVVNRALHDQLQLLAAHDPNAVATLTMRDELLTLYNTGRIKLADNVILIWDDEGSRAVMRQLPDSTTRTRAGGNGVYYHLAYCDNPRVQWIPLTLLRHEFGRIADAGATRYALFNVGNIREFVLPIRAAMQMVWALEPWRQDTDRPSRFLTEWARYYFGSEAAPDIAQLYTDYVALEYPCRMTSIVEGLISHTTAMELKLRAPAPYDYIWNPVSALDWVARSGIPVLLNWYARSMRFGPFHARLGTKLSAEYLIGVAPQWEALHERATELELRIERSGQAFFHANLLMQLETSRQVNRWAVASLRAFEYCAGGEYYAASIAFQTAASCMDAVFEVRKPSCTDKWTNWYRGEYHNVWATCPWALKPDWHANDSRALAGLARTLGEARSGTKVISAMPVDCLRGTVTKSRFMVPREFLTHNERLKLYLLLKGVERDGKAIITLNGTRLPDTMLHAKVYHEVVTQNSPDGIAEFTPSRDVFRAGENDLGFEVGGDSTDDRYSVEGILITGCGNEDCTAAVSP